MEEDWDSPSSPSTSNSKQQKQKQKQQQQQDESKSSAQSKLPLSKKSANPAERREVNIAKEANTAILAGDVMFKNFPDRPLKL